MAPPRRIFSTTRRTWTGPRLRPPPPPGAPRPSTSTLDQPATPRPVVSKPAAATYLPTHYIRYKSLTISLQHLTLQYYIICEAIPSPSIDHSHRPTPSLHVSLHHNFEVEVPENGRLMMRFHHGLQLQMNSWSNSTTELVCSRQL